MTPAFPPIPPAHDSEGLRQLEGEWEQTLQAGLSQYRLHQIMGRDGIGQRGGRLDQAGEDGRKGRDSGGTR